MPGLIEVLTKVGEDNVFAQPLLNCMTGVKMTARGASVTFTTDKITANDVVNPTSAEYVGIVIWVPRKLL